MPVLFAKPSSVLLEHELTLTEYLTKKVKFNLKDTQHTQLISACAQSVKDKLTNVHQIDIKMAAGFAAGISALLLSFILPFTLVAGAGFAYGAYQLGRRQFAYAEYTLALENLSKCCIWSLGEVSQHQARNHELKNNPVIQEMIATLAPLTNTQQLRDFIADIVEDDFIAEANKIKDNMVLFDEHLDKEKVDLYFKIYGYKQGGFFAILEGIGYAIKNGFIALASVVTSCLPGRSPA